MRKLIIATVAASAALFVLLFILMRAQRCNVETVYLSGQLTTDMNGWYQEDGKDVYNNSSQVVVKWINDIAKRKNIDAIIFDVNSNGGSVVAAEEIFSALDALEIPTAAIVRDSAFSAAYTAMSAVDKIFLSRSSQVGAIGVTGSYLQQYEKNLKEGVVFQALTSAKFKDLLNPNKQLTAEERKLIQGVIDNLHENVVALVAEGRGLSIEETRALADGSIFAGEKAIEKKLADSIGGAKEVEAYLENAVGKKIKLCNK